MVQLEQGHIIVVTVLLIIRVEEEADHFEGHLCVAGGVLEIFAQVNGPNRGRSQSVGCSKEENSSHKQGRMGRGIIRMIPLRKSYLQQDNRSTGELSLGLSRKKQEKIVLDSKFCLFALHMLFSPTLPLWVQKSPCFSMAISLFLFSLLLFLISQLTYTVSLSNACTHIPSNRAELALSILHQNSSR